MAKKKYNFYSLYSQLDLPYLETNESFIKDIFEILETKFNLKRNSKQRFIDLGCGDGRVVIYATLHYGIQSTGVEINLNLIEEAKSKLRLLQTNKIYKKRQLKKIRIRYEDLFQLNLNKYDFIYIFSLPTMQRFLKHIFVTIQNDATIVSYKYPLTDFDSFLKLEEEIKLKSKNQKISAFFYRKI
ncbi:MAG: class I SAM-dependent methyltransferase [Promethearchaeota archaeon]